MRCPACQQPTFETAVECACGFSLPALDRLLSMPPMLAPGLNDGQGALTRSERRQVMTEIARLERSFPQAGFSVVLASAPAEIGLSLYAFWLFNRTGIASAVERGGANRHVLLVIDPQAGHAACMIGYGLEPFLGEAELANALHAASQHLGEARLGQGISAFLTEVGCLLSDCVESLESTYGLGSFEYQGLAHLIESEQESAVAY
jgi:uncharacterized membrane protein YgcG